MEEVVARGDHSLRGRLDVHRLHANHAVQASLFFSQAFKFLHLPEVVVLLGQKDCRDKDPGSLVVLQEQQHDLAPDVEGEPKAHSWAVRNLHKVVRAPVKVERQDEPADGHPHDE